MICVRTNVRTCRGVTLAGLEIRNMTCARGLHDQVVEEESVVFSNVEVRAKRAGPSGLGDMEVTECAAGRSRERTAPGNDRSKIYA